MALAEVPSADRMEALHDEWLLALVPLRAAFDLAPVEDGVVHEAEEVIEGRAPLLGEMNPAALARWLQDEGSDFTASFVRCAGRCRVPHIRAAEWWARALMDKVNRQRTKIDSSAWRCELVRALLASDDLLVRDAAIQAAETWGDQALIAILEAHDDPSPFLNDYVNAIVTGISR